MSVAKGCFVRTPQIGVAVLLTPTHVPGPDSAPEPYQPDAIPFAPGETANVLSRKDDKWVYHGIYTAAHAETLALDEAALLGEWERYDRYPAALERSRSCRGEKRAREEERRRSLDEFGVVSRESVEGRVETRRGKGRRVRESRLEEVEEVREEKKERRGKHKKKPSLLMSIVAFA